MERGKWGSCACIATAGWLLAGCQSATPSQAGRKEEPGLPYGASVWGRTFERSNVASEAGHHWCTVGVSIDNQSKDRVTKLKVAMKLTQDKRVVFKQDVVLDTFVDQDTGEVWHGSQPRSFFKATGKVSVPDDVLQQMTGYWYDAVSSERAAKDDFSDPENVIAALRADRFQEVAERVKGQPALATVATESGHQPVHYAAWSKDPGLLELLLKDGADVNARTNWGLTPISVTASVESLDSNRALRAVQMLKEHGGDVKVQTKGGRSTLDFAVKFSNLYVCQYLLDQGVSPNTVTKNWTTLSRAVEAKRGDVVKLLLKSGSKPNLPNKSGYTPMHVAAQLDLTGILDLMVAHGGDVNVRGAYRTTPLHIAATVGADKSAKWLLAHGAMKNAKCDYGTARDLALDGGHPKVVQLLDASR